MNTTRLFRAVMTVGLLVAAACGGNNAKTPTILEPAPEWYDGVWKAVSADGVPMPASIGSRTYHYFYFGAKGGSADVSMGQTNRPQGAIGLLPEVFACSEDVDLTVRGDSLFTTEYNGKTKCSSPSFVRHTFVRSGGQLTSVYDNKLFILQKQ